MVPAGCVGPVPDELLVERGLGPARLVLIFGPEPRRIGSHHLIAQHDFGPRVAAELELGVGQDDPPLGSVPGSELVQLDRDPAEFLHQGPVADQLGGLVEGDVLVVLAELGLGRRGEDRAGQAVRLRQAGGQPDPADRAGLAVLAPARSGKVAPDDALDRVHVEPPDQHRLTPDFLGNVLDREQVVGDDRIGPVEPEGRHRGQDPALVGDRVGQDHVVDRDPIRGDQEQVVTGFVDLAHLAGGVEGKALEALGHPGDATPQERMPLPLSCS